MLSSEFADDFKAFFSDLLGREFGNKIREDIRNFRENIVGLRENPNYPNALKLLVELIMTNSWWRPLSRDDHMEYEKQFGLYHREFGDDGFRTSEGKKRLLEIAGEFATSNRRKSIQKVDNLIGILVKRNATLNIWTKNLYNLAMNRRTEILGNKGRDNYLRDFGYFKRAPLDRHEWRFIVRTGIFHYHAKREKSDPQDRDDLQLALVNFCENRLAGFEVEQINACIGQRLDLGKNAGMVDLFIWSYNADDRYHICGKKPQCHRCILRDSCLFAKVCVSF